MGKKESPNELNTNKTNKNNKRKNSKKNIKEEKTSKLLIIVPLFILIIGFIVGVYFYINRTEPSIALKQYFEYLNNKEYDKMYELVISDLSKEEFVSRVKNIYEGIEAKDIKITVATNSSKERNNKDTNITYTNSMKSIAGDITFLNNAKMKYENNSYKIQWNSNMIFPELDDNEKIRVTNIASTRGTLFDRNGVSIAKDGTVYLVGVVPGKMNETTDLKRLSELLQINEDTINSSIKETYVKEDTFVPLRKLSKEYQETKNELLKIKGVLITDAPARVYPYKEITSIMTGYIQDGEGKAGLEYVYNERLKGTDGKEIYIEKDSKKIKTIQKLDVKNGDDIKLTIDVNLQKKIYEQFKENQGATVSINYNTGEILALVSTPSYDANKFSLGITNEEWDEIQKDEAKPMYNRYLATYAPGSSLKPIVGAIGLQNNSFTPEENFGRSGTKWQEDSSWKDLYVTTLETYEGDANLENALVYSDNIYFAKGALKIGKEKLEKGLDNLGFNQKIEFVQEITKSTYGKMDSRSAIANSGYGQNQMLVNPILMASIYSAFANGGNMVQPCLEYKTTKYIKQNAISSEIANVIKNDLIQVVEKGTAKDAKIDGKQIAGKTGTAEIKKDQSDENGTEIGWFDVFDDNETLIISMVQNVKDIGGSHYVVKKVKNILE